MLNAVELYAMWTFHLCKMCSELTLYVQLNLYEVQSRLQYNALCNVHTAHFQCTFPVHISSAHFQCKCVKVQKCNLGCNAKPRHITRPKKYHHILLSPSLDEDEDDEDGEHGEDEEDDLDEQNANDAAQEISLHPTFSFS